MESSSPSSTKTSSILFVVSSVMMTLLLVPSSTVVVAAAGAGSSSSSTASLETTKTILSSPRSNEITSTTDNNSDNNSNDIYTMLNVQKPTTVSSFFTSKSLSVFQRYSQFWERTLRRWAWNLHGTLLPILHYGIPDVYVNLRVLWNKALIVVSNPQSSFMTETTAMAFFLPCPTANTTSSSLPNVTSTTVTDSFLSNSATALNISPYHLLPRYSRWILYYFHSFFPRWMHANIELRVVYLNRAIHQIFNAILQQQQQHEVSSKPIKVRLITIGSGYDTRSMELLLLSSFLQQQQQQKESSSLWKPPAMIIQEAWELDLPNVIDGKQKLIQSWRDRRQKSSSSSKQASVVFRQHQCLESSLHLVPVDLKNFQQVQSIMEQIDNDNNNNNDIITILISEAVLLYLGKSTNPKTTTTTTSNTTNKTNDNDAKNNNNDDENNIVGPLVQLFADYCDWFCFADRFPISSTTNTTNSASSSSIQVRDTVHDWLQDNGWILQDFLSKPGATQHLGIAYSKYRNKK